MISRKRCRLPRAMAGLGFFDERVQLPGMGVRCNSLIPKRFAVFQQPTSHSMNFPGFKLCDRRFNFLHGTHGGKLSDWPAGGKSARANKPGSCTTFPTLANGDMPGRRRWPGWPPENGRGSMAECGLPKPTMRVRFPSPAPTATRTYAYSIAFSAGLVPRIDAWPRPNSPRRMQAVEF